MSARIKLYVGGQIGKSELAQASALYLKQIRRWQIEVVEMSASRWGRLVPCPGEHWVGLAEDGRTLDSPAFAKVLDTWTQDRSTLCFIIGDFDGVPPAVMDRAQERLSLGLMTWPHLVARVLLLEQIYRAQQRALGHPYSFV